VCSDECCEVRRCLHSALLSSLVDGPAVAGPQTDGDSVGRRFASWKVPRWLESWEIRPQKRADGEMRKG
jgi:hypothetical protein